MIARHLGGPAQRENVMFKFVFKFTMVILICLVGGASAGMAASNAPVSSDGTSNYSCDEDTDVCTTLGVARTGMTARTLGHSRAVGDDAPMHGSEMEEEDDLPGVVQSDKASPGCCQKKANWSRKFKAY